MDTRSQAKPFGQRLIQSWLCGPENIHRRWLNKYTVGAAWLGLLLAALSPPQGNGHLVCWLNISTGLPCPGCGLTRSLSCAMRGMFLESWQQHPLGLLILVFFLAIAAASLLSTARQQQLASYMRSRAIIFNSLFLAFVATFLSFGVARAIMAFTSVW
jgi:hypothetical protein